MAIRIYNTLTRSKEEFKPGAPPLVTFYVCGPTVYDYIHIGNARVFIIFDVVRRYLEYRGYNVRFVQNYTDIDDKMINRANEQGITVPELAGRFINAYEEDVGALRVRPADVTPRATEHIDDIIRLIEQLLENGYAYISDGDVYYDTARFEGYGQLSHQKRRTCSWGQGSNRARKNAARLISYSGSRKRKANLPGTAPGARGGRAGILSARPCQPIS